MIPYTYNAILKCSKEIQSLISIISVTNFADHDLFFKVLKLNFVLVDKTKLCKIVGDVGAGWAITHFLFYLDFTEMVTLAHTFCIQNAFRCCPIILKQLLTTLRCITAP